MSLETLLPLALLGAILGLDSVCFPQAMISRPLVACTVTGLFLGAPAAGLVIGATLELIALETLPFGASRYPEWGPAGVIGAALYAPASDRAGALVTAVVAALAVAWVGGWSMVQLRKLNARWLRRRQEELRAGSRRAVVGLQLYGLNGDLMRGALLTCVAFVLLAPAQRAALDSWAGDPGTARALAAGAALVVGAGAVWKVFHTTPYARWLFLVGAGAGLSAMWIR